MSRWFAEIERSLQNINEAMAPYTRFVRAEHEKLGAMRATLDAATRDIDGLRARIEAPAVPGTR